MIAIGVLVLVAAVIVYLMFSGSSATTDPEATTSESSEPDTPYRADVVQIETPTGTYTNRNGIVTPITRR